MNEAMVQLLILAAIAVFLVLRLKSILGTREGFEPEETPVIAPRAAPPAPPEEDLFDHVAQGTPAARALMRIKEIEPAFSATQFLKGARGAYEMILMAFDKGDLERIRPFLAPEVFDAFAGVVAQRNADGLTVSTEFLGIREIELTDARLDGNEAELTVRFVAELISATRNAAGDLVDGDPKTARKQRDSWTFARIMGQGDPNWQLVATND